MRPILNIGLILGFIALIAGILTDKSITETLLYVGAYLIVVLVALIPIPYWLRTGILLVAIYIWGVTDLLSFGILGDSIFLFLAFVTMATMLFSTAQRDDRTRDFIDHTWRCSLVKSYW